MFQKKAEERAARELDDLQPLKSTAPVIKPEELQPVKAREEPLNLTANVGKFIAVASDAPNSEQAGFFCEMCDCLMKDSVSWLDHINGKKRIFLFVVIVMFE